MTDVLSELGEASEPADAGPNLELDANLVLAAGAGAGKTHALVTVALSLYVGAGASGRPALDPAEVWAVTFTDKAARELRQRILDRAAALAADPQAALLAEPELAALIEARGAPVPPGRWRAIVEQLPLAPIGTFHSLCAQVLRGFAVEAGVDPSFEVLEEAGAGELFELVLDEVLLRELETEDSNARAVARALGGPTQLRGALRRLHAKLGEEGRDPESLLVDGDGRPQSGFDALASRRELVDACEALAEAIALLEPSSEDRLQPTLRALAIERRRIGGCESEAVERWYPALVRVAAQRRGKGSLPKRARRVWEPFAAAWERVQDAVASLAEQALAARLVALLSALSRAYAEEKRRQGVLDFVDLVRGAHDLLRDDRMVRDQLQRRVGALLVDEFQDTNGLQLDLVHLLAEARDHLRELGRGQRASEHLPLGARLFAAVGDRKQSIYEFRGADVAIFQRLAAQARGGQDGLRLAALRRSWRSRPGLVAFANTTFSRLLISDDPAGFAVDWIDEVDTLEPVREDHPSQAELPAVQLLCSDPELDPRLRRGHEAELLAEHIALLLEAAPPLGRAGPDGAPAPLRGADVAILMRTHGHVARYRRALRERGVASVVVGGRGFYAAREVRELVALMLAIADPGDKLASAAVWRSPIWGIDDASLVTLASAGEVALSAHAEGCSVEDLDDPAAVAAITHMGRLVNRLHHELDRLGPARVLRFAVDRLAVREVLAWDDAGEQRIANVDKLLSLLGSRAFAGLGAQAAARRLLERSEDVLDREAPAEVAAAADPKAVRIMTVHAAKGLEFPVVVVPELGAEPRGQEGPVVFERELGLAVLSPDLVGRRRPSPHAQAIHERLAARRDAESRRLLYVATTRARDLLILLGEAPEGRGSEGNWRRMLDTLLPDLGDLVEVVEAPGATRDDDEGSDDAMGWLLERVARVRAATSSGGQASAAEDARAEQDRDRDETPDPDSDPNPNPDQTAAPTPERQHPLGPREDLAELDAALARSDALSLTDCELELSLSGLAEFDKCPRRYLLSHVVGVDTPATQEREAMRGLQLLPFVPRRGADEDDPGDHRPPSLAEARARGRLVHYLLGRVDLDRLGRDPQQALDAFASQDHIPDGLWQELRGDLLRLAERPWVRELVAIHRSDPRRVLRGLPFALEVVAEHEAPARDDEARLRPQLDLFAPPPTTGPAALPSGRVIVRGRMDLVWIDDAGRLNLVDWQYARAPRGDDDSGGNDDDSSELAQLALDPESVAGFRRLTQAWALRRMWGPEIPLRAGAVFLREAAADPGLVTLAPATLASFEQRLRRSAGRLLAVELLADAGGAPGVDEEPWPKLEHQSRCGTCVHLGRCWSLAPDTRDERDDTESPADMAPPPPADGAPAHAPLAHLDAPPSSPDAAHLDAPPHHLEAPPHELDAPPHHLDAPPHHLDAPPHELDAPPAHLDAPWWEDLPPEVLDAFEPADEDLAFGESLDHELDFEDP
ncbi:UvrD-helicase domain-containing protein [Pseudenhygromyxa sp. WMMC2535]|uniref:UvrD-helicase domain-containing protein n=1 Tax=Pseudenhygromyxa sp. WMMC2535 TaxID=2712867 RepID=UPI001554B11E|nr:UvrD-helicase domain-containing protein [Pseudenhygromyxa sp. WMMC2535]NVB42950.1 UvrD-helicase domain-containing protein [Pseudenhygromyxa sp. WMMC2535]